MRQARRADRSRRSARRFGVGDFHRVGETERGDFRADRFRQGVLAGDRRETQSGIRQAIGRMPRVAPLDQRRHEPAPGPVPVIGDRDAPAEIAACHRRDRAELRKARECGVDVVRARDPVREMRPFGQRRLHPRLVEIEPARTRRRRRRPDRWRSLRGRSEDRARGARCASPSARVCLRAAAARRDWPRPSRSPQRASVRRRRGGRARP